MGFSKLRRRDFDLSRLRRPLSDACCRAVRSTTGRYDRHSSSSAFGMEAAADPECASRWVDPTNRQGASSPVAGLWSLPFKGKLKVVRTLALAELRARQRIKPYQQLRYWSTVPFRHGPNDAVKFSAIPSPHNSARPLEKSNPKGLQDELVRHIKEDNLMSWFDFAVQFSRHRQNDLLGQDPRRQFLDRKRERRVERSPGTFPHGCEAYSSEELAFVIGSKRSDIFRCHG